MERSRESSGRGLGEGLREGPGWWEASRAEIRPKVRSGRGKGKGETLALS